MQCQKHCRACFTAFEVGLHHQRTSIGGMNNTKIYSVSLSGNQISPPAMELLCLWVKGGRSIFKRVHWLLMFKMFFGLSYLGWYFSPPLKQ
jgi:hypothetical protein